MNAIRLDPCCAIVDFRQYTLHPGQRDTLVELFDREFVETQEKVGMHVVGQFRDLDDPDRFVWLRGFPDHAARGEALAAFYGGPDWKAHSRAANATMVDSDDVLMLRPIYLGDGYPHLGEPRGGDPSLIAATVYHVTDEAAALDEFRRSVEPELDIAPLACLRTEAAPNTFPALPVREDARVVLWLARFADADEYDAHRRATSRVHERLAEYLTESPQQLRLAPTARSQLR
ncbi:MAG TPA: NIPSNAP family protein [Jatrophihabitantaceae bacterium]|jgi:quinol monooxygenase YgiN